MRQLLAIFLTILYHIGISLGLTSDRIPAQSMGIPSSEIYTEEQLLSRVPWDMVIVDNKLYLGGGDYSANTGPVDIWCCDLTTGQWSVSGTLNDEAIGKFITIGERVYAPGFDATRAWSFGNYHWLENGQWHTCDKLPDAVHNFDIVEYEGKLFFGIGTNAGTVSPVKISADQGRSFQDISFYKDGISILDNSLFDFTRVYDFFITENGLYCMLLPVKDGKVSAYEFYQYRDSAFHYVSSHSDMGLSIQALKQEPISAKVTYEGSCYIAAGDLTRTSDFTTSEHIVLPQNELAVDLLTDGGRLYVLSAKPHDSGYTVRIYAYVYNSFLYPAASFESENIPASFAKNGSTFYVGLSRLGANENLAGSVYEISMSELTRQILGDCG